MKYCPNCIEKLILNKKKLGARSRWYLCSSCGYRETPEELNISDANNLSERNKAINNSNFFREH